MLQPRTSFVVGDAVLWTGSDGDIPKNTEGEVVELLSDGERVRAKFPAGTWIFPIIELRPTLCSPELSLPGGFRFALKCFPRGIALRGASRSLGLFGRLVPPAGTPSSWVYRLGYEFSVLDPSGRRASKGRRGARDGAGTTAPSGCRPGAGSCPRSL